MKLYYKKGACSLAVRIVLHEIGVEFTSESVDLATKKTETGAHYLDVNPKGSVPALVLDDGKVLTENAVIQQYLADRFLATQLLPHEFTQFDRYRVLEWLNFISTDLHKGCAPLFLPHLPQEIKDTIFKPLIEKKLAYVESHLKGKDSLLWHFTLADSYLFVVLNWMTSFGIQLSVSFPHLHAYMQAMKTRPSVKKSLQEEHLL